MSATKYTVFLYLECRKIPLVLDTTQLSKVSFALEEAIMSQRGNRSTAYSFFNIGARLGDEW
jgi:hypothetical protein